MDNTYAVVDETYTIPAFKKKVCRNHANTLTLLLEKHEETLQVEARAYDDGVALRMIVDGEGEGSVLEERTGFALPQSAHQVYGMKYIFSYEDMYQPIPRCDLAQNRLAFPVLAECGNGVWALYAEAAVFGDYGGSTLLSDEEKPELLMVRRAPDQLSPTQTGFPRRHALARGDVRQPGRHCILQPAGKSESSVRDQRYLVHSPRRFGLELDDGKRLDPRPRTLPRICRLCGGDGIPVLSGRRRLPGYVDIAELVKYAEGKGVKIWLWEHSKDIRSPEIADEKFRLWSSWGVVGVKIDFFESDRAERVKQSSTIWRARRQV